MLFAMPEIWSVADLNRYVRQQLEVDYRLQEVRVQGEISGFKAYPSGHWYFTLKDAQAQINCVMWKGRAQLQRAIPREGAAVEVVGKVTLYESRGQFQLDVAHLQPRGAGDLYQQFLALKAQLEAEGLFASTRKRPLPAWPRRIGLVTSPQAAVLRDLLTILQRRYPVAEVVLAPTAVQGSDAPPQIVAALAAVVTTAPDVVIVGRGGGSLEDLWCFNDERVVRAIAACPVPIVSAVGHETDTTLADYAADVRAPTPSAAAELVTPDQTPLREQLAQWQTQLGQALHTQLRTHRWGLQATRTRLVAHSPAAQLAHQRQRTDDQVARLARTWHHRLQLQRARLARLTQALAALNPARVLERGYAIVSDPAGHPLHTAAAAPPGTLLHIRLHTGELTVQVVTP